MGRIFGQNPVIIHKSCKLVANINIASKLLPPGLAIQRLLSRDVLLKIVVACAALYSVYSTSPISDLLLPVSSRVAEPVFFGFAPLF